MSTSVIACFSFPLFLFYYLEFVVMLCVVFFVSFLKPSFSGDYEGYGGSNGLVIPYLTFFSCSFLEKMLLQVLTFVVHCCPLEVNCC